MNSAIRFSAAVLVALTANNINRDGGWGFLVAAARLAPDSPQRVSASMRESPIPTSLLRHFEALGVRLTPVRAGNETREWVVESVDVGPRCEVIAVFRSFASGTTADVMKTELMAVSAPAVLNVEAGLAMHYPFARGRTPDLDACAGWSTKSPGAIAPLLDAFKSYRPQGTISLSPGIAAGIQAPAAAMPDSLRAHVKEDRFGIVTSVRGLPLGVRDGLQALFGRSVLDIAEPGAAFRATDVVIDPKLPTRRLVHAACSMDHCVVYYERGGIAHTWQVAIFHWTPAATRFEWGGSAPGGLRTIAEVRDAILTGAIKRSSSW